MSENNFFLLTWEHYGILVEDLWKDLKKKLEEKNIEVDAIVSILREGVFTAVPLSYKVLTIQYKYMLHDGSNELKKIAGLSESSIEISEEPLFLLCDTFPCGGKTKFLAVEDIKLKYPKAKFVFASLVQDYSVENHEDFLTSAYAFDVNDKWETTHPLFKKLGIANNALDVVLPWENSDEEYAAVRGKEWKYN